MVGRGRVIYKLFGSKWSTQLRGFRALAELLVDLLGTGYIGELTVAVTSGLQSVKNLSERCNDQLFLGMPISTRPPLINS